jgi:hypothetical protein
MGYEAKLLEAMARGIQVSLGHVAASMELGSDRQEVVDQWLKISDALVEWKESRRPWHATSDYENQARRDIGDSQGH